MTGGSKPDFPFATAHEEGHHYVSIHDVVKIEVEAPELITVDSHKTQTYWGAAVILTSRSGETYFLSIINTDKKPVLELINTAMPRERDWWKKPKVPD